MYELMQRYQGAVEDLFRKVRETQTENIIKAGEMVADCVENGGCVFLTSICHSIENDLIYRGGGPLFYKPFSYSFNINNDAYKREGTVPADRETKIARYALELSNCRPGDILVVSSVSGRTRRVVDLAWEAMDFGMKVIAFTSMEYATQVEPVHPSGKKLYEFVTLALDNCAPAAEAMLEVEGLEAKYAAASGIASDYIMWNLTSVAVEKMMKDGKTPGILKSANFPGGPEYNNGVIQPHYDKYGW